MSRKSKEGIAMNINPRKKHIIYCISPVIIFLVVSNTVAFIIAGAMIAQNIDIINTRNLSEILDAILDDSLIYSILTYNTILAGIFAAMFFRDEAKQFDDRYHNKLKLSDVMMLVLYALSAYFVVTFAYTILQQLLGNILPELFAQHSGALDDLIFGKNILMSILAFGLLAPLAEELMMRALVFNRFRNRTSVKSAIVISSAIFGLLHFPVLLQMIYAFSLGLILAYSYYKYQNIIVPIMIHVVFNCANFLLLIPQVNSLLSTAEGVSLIFVLSIAMFVTGLVLIIRKKPPELNNEADFTES